jgi:hypothetical protein
MIGFAKRLSDSRYSGQRFPKCSVVMGEDTSLIRIIAAYLPIGSVFYDKLTKKPQPGTGTILLAVNE